MSLLLRTSAAIAGVLLSSLLVAEGTDEYVRSTTLVYGRTDVVVEKDGVVTRCARWDAHNRCVDAQIKVTRTNCYGRANLWHTLVFDHLTDRRGCPNFCWLSTTGGSAEASKCSEGPQSGIHELPDYTAHGGTSLEMRSCGSTFAYSYTNEYGSYNQLTEESLYNVLELDSDYPGRFPRAEISCSGWRSSITSVEDLPGRQPFCAGVAEMHKCGASCSDAAAELASAGEVEAIGVCDGRAGDRTTTICIDECFDFVVTPAPTDAPTPHPTNAPTDLEAPWVYRESLVPGRTDVVVRFEGFEMRCADWNFYQKYGYPECSYWKHCLAWECMEPQMRVDQSICSAYAFGSRWHRLSDKVLLSDQENGACHNFCHLSTSGANHEAITCNVWSASQMAKRDNGTRLQAHADGLLVEADRLCTEDQAQYWWREEFGRLKLEKGELNDKYEKNLQLQCRGWAQPDNIEECIDKTYSILGAYYGGLYPDLPTDANKDAKCTSECSGPFSRSANPGDWELSETDNSKAIRCICTWNVCPDNTEGMATVVLENPLPADGDLSQRPLPGGDWISTARNYRLVSPGVIEAEHVLYKPYELYGKWVEYYSSPTRTVFAEGDKFWSTDGNWVQSESAEWENGVAQCRDLARRVGFTVGYVGCYDWSSMFATGALTKKFKNRDVYGCSRECEGTAYFSVESFEYHSWCYCWDDPNLLDTYLLEARDEQTTCTKQIKGKHLACQGSPTGTSLYRYGATPSPTATPTPSPTKTPTGSPIPAGLAGSPEWEPLCENFEDIRWDVRLKGGVKRKKYKADSLCECEEKCRGGKRRFWAVTYNHGWDRKKKCECHGGELSAWKEKPAQESVVLMFV